MDQTYKYLQYKTLDDWDDDDIVVVELFDSETGNVRAHHPNRQSGPKPIEDAFDEAHRLVVNEPHLEKVGVFLHRGVNWSSSWGVLVEQKSSLIGKPFRR